MNDKTRLLKEILLGQAEVEKRLAALEEALVVHENRLNGLNIPAETVNVISLQTLRMHGQMLLAITEPQKQAEIQAETPAQEAEEAPVEGVS